MVTRFAPTSSPPAPVGAAGPSYEVSREFFSRPFLREEVKALVCVPGEGPFPPPQPRPRAPRLSPPLPPQVRADVGAAFTGRPGDRLPGAGVRVPPNLSSHRPVGIPVAARVLPSARADYNSRHAPPNYDSRHALPHSRRHRLLLLLLPLPSRSPPTALHLPAASAPALHLPSYTSAARALSPTPPASRTTLPSVPRAERRAPSRGGCARGMPGAVVLTAAVTVPLVVLPPPLHR